MESYPNDEAAEHRFAVFDRRDVCPSASTSAVEVEAFHLNEEPWRRLLRSNVSLLRRESVSHGAGARVRGRGISSSGGGRGHGHFWGGAGGTDEPRYGPQLGEGPHRPEHKAGERNGHGEENGDSEDHPKEDRQAVHREEDSLPWMAQGDFSRSIGDRGADIAGHGLQRHPRTGPAAVSAGARLLDVVALHHPLAEGSQAQRRGEGRPQHRLPRDAGGESHRPLGHQRHRPSMVGQCRRGGLVLCVQLHQGVVLRARG